MKAPHSLLLLVILMGIPGPAKSQVDAYPNIVVILADDLGYGDLSCYNKTSHIKTDHIDALARQGIRFTDAHSSSAVCTPTRYSILTGGYAWRSRLKQWVLREWDPPLIQVNQLTLSSMLREKGYHTAAVGKWHLGWNWPTTDGVPAKKMNGYNVDYSKPIQGGPLDYGFDYYFGDDVPNFPPYTFIENENAVAQPTLMKPDSLFGGNGQMAEGWKLEKVMPAITAKAVEIIDRAAKNSAQPFFLYFALTAPHTPIAPSGQFKNKSKVGRYGDYVMQVDWSVGEVIQALQRNDLDENTLIIFTSDNGSPARDGTNFAGRIGSVTERYGHRPSGNLRGLKADIWEGGHRVPFIVSWKGKIDGNTTDDHTICSMDIMNTIANLVGYSLPGGVAQDSRNILPLFFGEEVNGLESRTLIHHSGSGVFAVRHGDWKLILSNRSGGFSDNLHKEGYGIDSPGQLYNLSDDLGERNNLYDARPDIVRRLISIFETIRGAD